LRGTASTLLVTATIRPDVVIALVIGVPSAIGLLRVRARSVTLTVFGNRG
jgi:tRNA pseudouridine-54 N-methylase